MFMKVYHLYLCLVFDGDPGLEPRDLIPPPSDIRALVRSQTVAKLETELAHEKGVLVECV